MPNGGVGILIVLFSVAYHVVKKFCGINTADPVEDGGAGHRRKARAPISLPSDADEAPGLSWGMELHDLIGITGDFQGIAVHGQRITEELTLRGD